MLKISKGNKKNKGWKKTGIGGLVLLCCINVTPLSSWAGGQKGTTALTTRPSTQKATVTRASKQASSRPVVRCRGRARYGNYCLGWIIGPQIRSQILRCPHDGTAISVKALKKHWNPRQYDSDLRPYMGHYQHSDQIWLCPRCGYAAYPRDFFRPYPKRRMEYALRGIRKTFGQSDKIPVAYRLRVAQASYWARGKQAKFLVDLLVLAMWSAREEKKLKFAAQLRKQIIAGLRLCFRRGLYALSEQPRKAYLLGELYRQEGKWQQTLHWLDRAYQALQQQYKKVQPKPKAYQWLEKIIFSCQQKAVARERKIYILP